MSVKLHKCGCGRDVYASPCTPCKNRKSRAEKAKMKNLIQRLERKIANLTRINAALLGKAQRGADEVIEAMRRRRA